MNLLGTILGIALIVLVAQDTFETVVLPRRVQRRIRLARLYYRTIYKGWSALGRRVRSSAGRDSFLGYVGPLSLLGLFVFWAVLFVLGFGLVMWGLALPLNVPGKSDFFTYLYMSGTTFFTLGLGDFYPQSGVGHFVMVSEVGLGFIFLALEVSYVPVIYQAFSRRELRISILDARAGSPPTAVELLRRNCVGKNGDELRMLLHDWEEWSADILESHLSYPILAYYRSQHEQQSWVGALTVILDTCALVLTTLKDVQLEPARFSFAMARHTVVDLAQVLGAAPATAIDRLPSAEFARLQEFLAGGGLHLQQGATAEQELAALRATYEPFVSALAERMLVSLPPWIPQADTPDSWQTSAWDAQFPSVRRTLDKVMHSHRM